MDASILNSIQEYLRTGWLDTVMQIVTHLGDWGVIWFIAAVILISQPKYRRWGIAVALAVIMAAIIGTFILKPLIDRPRPFIALGFTDLLIPAPIGTSFPSNHSMASFAAAAVICLLPERGANIKALKVGAVVVAALIAFSRVYLYVHYPTDIIAGAVFGVGIGVAAVAIARALPKWAGPPIPRH